MFAEMLPKRLELLSELVPKAGVFARRPRRCGARSDPHPHRRRPEPRQGPRKAHGATPFPDIGATERGHQTTRAGRYAARIGGQLQCEPSHDFEAEMSLKGQWIGKYSGTNTGMGVIDLDEFDDHFSGTALAWDDNPTLSNSFVRIRTSSKSTTQHLTKLPLIPIDAVGNIVSPENVNRLKLNNILMPATVDIDLRLHEDVLSIQWSSSIGTAGGATANATKTRGALPSELVPTRVQDWDGFKRKVNAIEQKRYIFRGQTTNVWRSSLSG